ncbi:hypothetical protein [Psychroserpens ponticola]|uniref:Uncharacterized protein n=1 Tax=Psychroserpens ponticola TaxID=2932268 RepID=A0ABY7RVL6_9FLAO|nr:hypothetical protein [Psychroserpens ponticola]WCO01023.1 hypothetical protein MUN68_013210 [Psychroserpens ponticola]
MKSLFLSICTLVITLQAQTQELANFEWSELSNSTVVGAQNPELVFPSESGFTVYSVEDIGSQFYAPKIIYITKFDVSGKSLSTIDFKLPIRSRKDATLLKIIEGDNKLYFFSHVAVKKDGKNVLYAQIYDNETDQVSDTIELYTIPIEKVNNSGFFEIAISSDKNTFAVLVNKPFVKKTKEAINVLTFDEHLKKLSETSPTLSFGSERAYKETLFVENDGIVNIIKKEDTSKKHPITSIITIKGNDVNEQKVSTEGFYISDCKVIAYNNSHYILGFATDNAKPVVSMGGAKDNSFFIYNISEGQLVKNQEWSKETVKRVLGKGYIDLKVKDILIDNENIYLIGDCYSKDSEAIEGKNFEYNYTHRFGPGIIIKLDINGNVTYDVPLNYSEDYLNRMEVLGSFYPFLNNGKLFVFANEKESKLKNKKIVMGYDKINAKAIVLKSFDAEGNIETIPFWNSKTGGAKKYTTFAPTQTLQITDKTFYIYAIGKEMHKFGKMILK